MYFVMYDFTLCFSVGVYINSFCLIKADFDTGCCFIDSHAYLTLMQLNYSNLSIHKSKKRHSLCKMSSYVHFI